MEEKLSNNKIMIKPFMQKLGSILDLLQYCLRAEAAYFKLQEYDIVHQNNLWLCAEKSNNKEASFCLLEKRGGHNISSDGPTEDYATYRLL